MIIAASDKPKVNSKLSEGHEVTSGSTSSGVVKRGGGVCEPRGDLWGWLD